MTGGAMRQVGTPCPDCGSIERGVIESRPRAGGSIYRRCFCRRCGTRYSTREQLVGEAVTKTPDDNRAERLRRAAMVDQIDRIERSLAILKRNLPPIHQ
jgi:transcriptional regulator NrdR family protein